MLIHTVAAVILKIAYLVSGCLLCYMGQKLLEKGVEGRTKVEGEVAGNKWMLLTSSPGIVYAMCGLCIIIYTVITPTIYEEESSTVQNEPGAVGKTTPASSLQQYETITSKSSRLIDQPSGDSALLISRTALYALQHRNRGLVDQDVTSLIEKMPTAADQEQWSSTYRRFGEILRKNPSALLKMLSQQKYSWLEAKDREDGILSDLAASELEKLGAGKTRE